MTTLQELIGEDASFADAYDVLGRAQVELGNFSQAIETYRTASSLTPDSSGAAAGKLGMMSYYMGDRETATKVLARAAILGIDSIKLFDFQSLVLLTFSYFAENDRARASNAAWPTLAHSGAPPGQRPRATFCRGGPRAAAHPAAAVLASSGVGAQHGTRDHGQQL